jgi:hypothetical protein
MKGLVLTYFTIISFTCSFAQQNTLLLNSFFKDKLFDNSTNDQYIGSSFLPVYESEYSLNDKVRDSSKQYYDLTETLFKKHLFEAKGSNYYITISPVIDLQIGKDLADTADRRLFQNTRGVFVECDLYKNFSFSTAFYENQGRYSNYESNYYKAHGELYPNQSAGKYTTQNAVIPGGGRTKIFKLDGFDYAYAVGNLVYKPHRSIVLSAGNTTNFIGDGYRSLLLSDNSVASPYFRASFRLSEKWEFNYLRSRLINLMRRPVSTTVEAYYETKAFSTNYVSFKPNSKITISLFEGVIWSKGDSIVSKRVNPLYYNPIPFVANIALSENEVNSVIGLNFSMLPFKSHRIYGQLAIGNLNSDQLAYQLGYRGYNYFGLKNFMVQMEYNNVSNEMYTSSNSRLTYSHYNLPLAHTKGNSFQEFILRNNYEWKRVYYDVKSILYLLKDYSSVGLLPVKKETSLENGFVFLQQIELGYRFNKKMNLTLFFNWQYRSEQLTFNETTNQFFIGLRTGINNHYNDF